jgi:spermidine synthase
MSSAWPVAEIALATLCLAEVAGDRLDVVVGGLGLGFTAAAVLDDERVRSVEVVEVLEQVVGWHHRGLLPLSERLTGDARCRLVTGDFFAAVRDAAPFSAASAPRCDALLVDIDHSPRAVLHGSHAGFYTSEGLRRAAGRLRAGGVFGLWSDDPPDAAFLALLDGVFARSRAEVVAFPNPLTGGESANTVYVAVCD